jgi:hypothetical protein
MARDFAEYVLGGRAEAAQVAALEHRIQPGKTTTIELARAAMLELVDQWPTLGAPSADTTVTVATARHAIEERCLDCHDGTEQSRPDFSKPDLPRDTVVAMIDTVAFGVMPKNDPLAVAERAAFVEPLLAGIWKGADASAARAYFLDRMTALPTYRPEVIFSLIHARAGMEGSTDWRIMERSIRSDAQQASPGLFTEVGLEAIESCKRGHHTRAEIDRCIENALRVEDIVVDHR